MARAAVARPVVVAARRTPFARAGGELAAHDALGLSLHALDALLASSPLPAPAVERLAWGIVAMKRSGSSTNNVLEALLVGAVLWAMAFAGSRRQGVHLATAAVALLACGVSLAQMQRALSDGQTTSETVVTETLAAIDATSANNAFITINRQNALVRARNLDEIRARGEFLGPLHGVPIAVKDNIHVAGMPNTAGTPALRTFVPGTSASVVDRLEAACAIVIGKTNMHELAFGITSANRAFGAVANAHNAEYFAGGSSGGPKPSNTN